jgi:hypothetical protein
MAEDVGVSSRGVLEAVFLCFCVGAKKQRPALKKQWPMAGPQSRKV